MSSATPYVEPAEIIEYTGVRPETLGLQKTADLNARLQAWAAQAKDIIDRDRGQNFSDKDPIPPLVKNIALRIAGNMVRATQRQRNSAVATVDGEDGEVPASDSRILTPAILSDLARIPRKAAIFLSISPDPNAVAEENGEDQE